MIGDDDSGRRIASAQDDVIAALAFRHETNLLKRRD
jgi:hypothetical protein